MEGWSLGQKRSKAVTCTRRDAAEEEERSADALIGLARAVAGLSVLLGIAE